MRICSILTSFIALCATLTLCASCNDSAEPTADTTAPLVDLGLSVHLTGVWCPALVSFRANPMGSTDNETERDDLRIRWDFNDDGTWDSLFAPIALQDGIAIDPLPAGTWTVRCEVVDLAGNVATHVESIDLPEWIPVAPDIIAGSLTTRMTSLSDAPTDTIDANTEIMISLPSQDWITPGGQMLEVRFYVDDVLVEQHSEPALTPRPYRCDCHFALVPEGIAEPGRHEIRAVVDAADAIAESNEWNNVSTLEVYVRE